MKLRNRRRLRNLEQIVGALAEQPMTVQMLSERVNRSPGLLYPDLQALVMAHRITHAVIAGRTYYRVAP